MLSEGFGLYSQDDGEPLKALELGSELARLIFWKDLYIARLRADGLWPRATLCDTIYKGFKRLFVLLIYLQDNPMKRGAVPIASRTGSIQLLSVPRL